MNFAAVSQRWASPAALGTQRALARAQQPRTTPPKTWAVSVGGPHQEPATEHPAATPAQQQPLRHPVRHQAADRRGVLALLAATGAAALPAPHAAAALPPAGAPVEPLPVPELTETYVSPEGFRFDYPAGWVVAFDRSGSTGNGAVIVVGDFRALITVTVFRTVTLAESTLRQGLSEATGYEICVDPQQRQTSTQRFQLRRSEMVPGAVGREGGGGGAPPPPAYEFEYSIESCIGDTEEGLGGQLRCLGPFGNVIPTQQRRHVGRCLLAGGYAYSLNGSSPEERWPAVGAILSSVVSTFRA